jgi:hypothetical protein
MKTSHLIFAMLALLLQAALALAQTATYTFESPQWVLGNTSPFLDMSPDTAPGLPTFSASFTSSPDDGGFAVTGPWINPSFSGQTLVEYGPYQDTLTITLSQPIKSVHMDFVLFAPGHFDLTSEAGTASVFTETTMGSLDFQGTTSFSEFSLVAIDSYDNTVPFAMDNLVMTIPEPSTLALVGLGAVGLMIARQRAAGAGA